CEKFFLSVELRSPLDAALPTERCPEGAGAPWCGRDTAARQRTEDYGSTLADPASRRPARGARRPRRHPFPNAKDRGAARLPRLPPRPLAPARGPDRTALARVRPGSRPPQPQRRPFFAPAAAGGP